MALAAEQITEEVDEAPEASAKSDDTLLVMDMTCKPSVRAGKNVHEVWYNDQPHPYTFSYMESTEMPREHAMRLVRIPEFRVTDHDGTRYMPTPDVKAGQAIPTLEVGQVVARLDELTNYALVMRANQYDGGDAYRRTSKKEEVIDFLMGVQKHQKNASLSRARVPAGMLSEDGVVGED